MAFDYDYYNGLTSQRSRNEAQQRQTTSEINDLDHRISRLQTAYRVIDARKERVKDCRNNVKNAVDNTWKGSHARTVYTSCESGDLRQSYDDLIQSIDCVEDSINQEINRLNNLKAQKWGFLSGLIQAWNNLTTAIQNCFN